MNAEVQCISGWQKYACVRRLGTGLYDKTQYSIIFRTGSFLLKLEREIFSYWSLPMK